MPYVAKPAWDRFWPKVDAAGDCWLWTAAQAGGGYGTFSIPGDNGRSVQTPAHRWAYEALVGPIPAGLELDHLCRVRACVNPDHLQPVTTSENIRRGAHTLRGRCRKGHPLSAGNLVVIAGTQRCRTCKNTVWLDWAKRTGRVAA